MKWAIRSQASTERRMKVQRLGLASKDTTNFIYNLFINIISIHDKNPRVRRSIINIIIKVISNDIRWIRYSPSYGETHRI